MSIVARNAVSRMEQRVNCRVSVPPEHAEVESAVIKVVEPVHPLGLVRLVILATIHPDKNVTNILIVGGQVPGQHAVLRAARPEVYIAAVMMANQ